MEKPSLDYRPGQWIFLNCPSVSTTQWHPFTITSCPFDPYISVHIRMLGDFTRDLGDALGAGPAQAELYDSLDPNGMYEVALEAGQNMPKLRVDGPYGAPAEDVFASEVAVLIGTGIGVTPFASVLKQVWHLRRQQLEAGMTATATGGALAAGRRLKRVEFIWICRDPRNFAWFQALLHSLEAQSLESAPGAGEDFLRIHTYLTSRLDEDTAANIIINTVGAKQDPLTELRARTHFGRPNFGRLFRGMRDGIRSGEYMPNLDRDNEALEASKRNATTKVGVYFCGPGAAAREIKSACKESSSGDIKFSFWKEHF
jgi:NADPH oxidase